MTFDRHVKSPGRPTFEVACSRYPRRYTMESVPNWAWVRADNGRFHAPQYRTDREWYRNTVFPGEPGNIVGRGICLSSNPSWPLGQWLDAPFHPLRHEV